MKTDSTGIAARMMLSLDRERICECLLSHRQLQSTPLQVRYPQGVRDALGIMSEQLSLSVSDLTRILVEDALSEMFLPADNIVRRLLSRMEHIMQAHDISATTMAALLAPWNIRPAVFREPDRLTDYLTGEILAALADWFYLSPEWLNGRVHYPLYRPGDWPATQEIFCRIISARENMDIILWHGFPFAGTHSGEYCGVLLRQKKEINNTIIYPVLSLYPVRMRRLVSDGPKNISGYPCSRRNTHSGTGRISDNRKNITHCVIQGSVIPLVIILSNKPE